MFQLSRVMKIRLQRSMSKPDKFNWRPSIVAISTNAVERKDPKEMLRWISHHYGFGTLIHFIKGRLDDETVKEAGKIQKMLIEQIYVPSPYTIKKIQDGPSQKERIIFKPRFYPDQIIHWALMLQLQAVITKGMYEYTCGSVPGRGTSCGQKMIRKWLDKDYHGTKYCLKIVRTGR